MFAAFFSKQLVLALPCQTVFHVVLQNSRTTESLQAIEAELHVTRIFIHQQAKTAYQHVMESRVVEQQKQVHMSSSFVGRCRVFTFRQAYRHDVTYLLTDENMNRQVIEFLNSGYVRHWCRIADVSHI